MPLIVQVAEHVQPVELLNSRAPERGVWPPAGSALRGTTLGAHLQHTFYEEYAVPVHLYRTFRSLPPKMDELYAGDEHATAEHMQLTTDERLHIARC